MHFRPIHHGVVDSTSERAFASLDAGEAQHGDVHVARGQTAGRGRQGNAWHSAPDEGLYMSVVVLPTPPPLKPPALTIASGLAIVEALTDLGLPPFREQSPRLKWPNDVLVGGAKICGILTESRGYNPKRPHFVIGIGLNVRQLHFPADLMAERSVTSLAALGVETGIADVMDAVLARLAPRLAQVRSNHRLLAQDYLEASCLRDQTVLVKSGKETWRGTVRDLSLADGLELQTAPDVVEHLPIEFIQSVERVDTR